MPTAVSYQRFSSKKQASGESLNRQAAAAAKWIADHPQHDLILDQTLTDSARSAYKGMHVEEGELGKFLIAVKDGRIPAGTWLIVESLDRLSRRRVMEATNQLTGLCLAGLTVVTTIDSKIYTADSGMADMIISVAYMAQAYQTSRDKSDRISATKVIRVEQAKGTKQVLHQNCPGWLRVTEAATPSNTLTRRYERSPERIETVKWIYEQALYHGAAW